jgi:DNA-binding XRE family transcriptional regulator
MSVLADVPEPTHALVRRLRLERGLTQVDLGLRAELSHNTIGLIERTPGYVPKLRVRRRLARALGLSVKQLWPAA